MVAARGRAAQAAGRLRGAAAPRRRGRDDLPRAARAAGADPAGLHGALGVRRARRAAADRQRQAGPRGAARAGPRGPARPGYVAPRTPVERELAADLGRGARRGPRRRRTTTSSRWAATRSSASRWSPGARQAGLRADPHRTSSVHQTIGELAAGRRTGAARRLRAGRRRGGGRAGSAHPHPALVPRRHDRRPQPLHHVDGAGPGRRPRRGRAARRRWTRWSRTTTHCGCGSTRAARRAPAAPALERRLPDRSRPVAGRAERQAAGRIRPSRPDWCRAAAGPRSGRQSPTLFLIAPPPGHRRGVLADPAGRPGDRVPAGGAGQPVALGPKTASYAAWARRLAEHVRTGGLRRRSGALAAGVHAPRRSDLPVDRQRTEQRGSARTIAVRLGPRRHRGAAAQGARCLPHADQRRAAERAGPGARPAGPGATACWSDLEGHGREESVRRRGPVPHRRLVHRRCSRSR